METKTRKIAELKPAAYNPRTMPPEEMEALKRSLAEFGWAAPIVVNTNPERKDVVIGGHQRLYAAKELGWESCPTVEVDLGESDEKILNIALNRIAGQWDRGKLDAILQGLEDDGADVSLAGFDAAVPAVETGSAEPAEPTAEKAEDEQTNEKQCPRCGHVNQ